MEVTTLFFGFSFSNELTYNPFFIPVYDQPPISVTAQLRNQLSPSLLSCSE